MKKLAFSVFAAVLTFGGVNAADEVPASESCCGYDGFYFGLGGSIIDNGVRTETTDAKWNSNRGTADYTGSDLGVDTNTHHTKFAGSLTLGYGRRIREKAYVGIEAGLDAARTSYFSHAGLLTVTNRQYEVDSKINGLTPSVALKLGFIHPETRGMIYLKAGAAYSKVKAWYQENDRNRRSDTEGFLYDYGRTVAKWSPIIALGAEKLFKKNIRTRLEVEYKFKTDGKVDFNNGLKETEGKYYGGTIKVTNKDSVTLRAMVIYTFGK
jgi:opacity protein-like surface antigen